MKRKTKMPETLESLDSETDTPSLAPSTEASGQQAETAKDDAAEASRDENICLLEESEPQNAAPADAECQPDPLPEVASLNGTLGQDEIPVEASQEEPQPEAGEGEPVEEALPAADDEELQVQDDTSAEGQPQEVAELPQEEPAKGKGKRRRRKKRIKFYERSLDQDIKYRGFLSYRVLRIMAWVALCCAQAAIFVGLGVQFDAKFAVKFSGLLNVLQAAGTLMTPLFMIATFATILNGKKDIRRILLLYGVFSIAVLLLFFLLHDHVMVGLYKKWMSLDRKAALAKVDELLRTLPSDRFISFNIFIDLFLCTLFTFFLVYQPKLKIFQGKMVIMFRLLALLPAMYEVFSVVLKVGAYTQILTLSPYIYPFLTTKPPVSFLIFVAMAFFIKLRERVYTRKGRTKEEYNAFLDTNLNSLHFSIYTSIVIVIAVVLDFILMFVVGFATLGRFPAETVEESLMLAINSARHVGLGETTPMLVLVPVVMLFSYTRSHKNGTFDLILPWFGIIGVVLVWIEGLYQVLLRAPDLLGKFLGG